ncbi:MAG: cytochrome b/b6 domain-containing protein [Acetobacteraceae bacterium]
MTDTVTAGGQPASRAQSEEGGETKAPPGMRQVCVWDPATRLFHWAIAFLVAWLYVTWRVNWMGWHVRGGEALLALLVFRFLWGFFGAETARFAHFAASPAKAFRHLVEFFHREPDTRIGHNPAGGWMVFVMLGLLLCEVLTGLYVNNDVADEGPLTEIVPVPIANGITDLHAILWDLILAAIVLHLLAILAYAVIKGQNLVGPMLSGRKRLPEALATPHQESLVRAAVLFAVAVGAAALISYSI